MNRKLTLALLTMQILALSGPVNLPAQPGGGGATFIPTFSCHHPATCRQCLSGGGPVEEKRRDGVDGHHP